MEWIKCSDRIPDNTEFVLCIENVLVMGLTENHLFAGMTEMAGWAKLITVQP